MNWIDVNWFPQAASDRLAADFSFLWCEKETVV